MSITKIIRQISRWFKKNDQGDNIYIKAYMSYYDHYHQQCDKFNLLGLQLFQIDHWIDENNSTNVELVIIATNSSSGDYQVTLTFVNVYSVACPLRFTHIRLCIVDIQDMPAYTKWCIADPEIPVFCFEKKVADRETPERYFIMAEKFMITRYADRETHPIQI